MSSKATRPVHRPPRDFSKRAIPVAPQRVRLWFRLHPRGVSAIHYSQSQANRFAVPPVGDLGTLYLAADPRTCLLERYGDEIFGARRAAHDPMLPASDWRSRNFSRIKIPRMRVCDLMDEATLAACGVDLGTLTSPDLILPQAWAQAIINHPLAFDAIRYPSRFTVQPCLAVYNRRKLNLVVVDSEQISNHPAGESFIDEFNVALV